MKIGIMGGTFDPIHYGHIMLGESAYQQFNLDEVWFMPNGNPPHKEQDTILCTIQQRLDMVKLAIWDYSYFKLSTIETEEDRIYYSYETMNKLKAEYPKDSFYFIIGADSLFAFEQWVHPEYLSKSCYIVAACRDGCQISEMQKQMNHLHQLYHGRFLLLQTSDYPVSATQIRDAIRKGADFSKWVPEKVADYIKQYHLYKG